LSYLVLLLIGMTATLLQSTLLRDLLPAYLVPDPLLLMVLFASLSFPFGRGLLVSFFLGLLTDLLSGAPQGWNALFALCIFTVNKGILARILPQAIPVRVRSISAGFFSETPLPADSQRPARLFDPVLFRPGLPVVR
jgi:rod shape-determining protein MreD